MRHPESGVLSITPPPGLTFSWEERHSGLPCSAPPGCQACPELVSPPRFVLSVQPTKVLGIYTFTKRVALEEMENKPRKQQGYSTVSHFNIVHYDCHLAAVR